LRWHHECGKTKRIGAGESEAWFSPRRAVTIAGRSGRCGIGVRRWIEPLADLSRASGGPGVVPAFEDLLSSRDRELLDDQRYASAFAGFSEHRGEAVTREHRLRRIHDGYLVAITGQRNGLITGPAADIGHSGRRPGQMIPQMSSNHLGAHPAAQRPVMPVHETPGQRSPQVISRHQFSLPQAPSRPPTTPSTQHTESGM